MNDKRKIVAFFLALLCNFTFLATAQSNAPTEEAKKLPECIKSHGEDSLETRRTMSVLQEDYKNKDYVYAYQWYTYMFTKAPCAYKSVYQYGPVIISALIDNPKFAARKKGLTDTLLMVFPTRIKYFGEEAVNKARWAKTIGRYRPEQATEALNLYAFYFESEKDRLDDVSYLKDNMQQAIAAHKKLLYTKEQLFTLYDQLSSYTEVYKARYSNDTNEFKSWNNTSLILDKMMKPYLKCADVDAIYQPKLKADPENPVLISKVIKLYQNAGPLCKDNPNFIALVEKSFALEPNARAAEELGNYFDKKKNTVKANQYLEKAADLSTDNAKKEELYIKLARRYVSSNVSMARSFASKVLAINPNNGTAIIIQGIALYKAKCGDKFDQAMAACAAVDMFNRAKAVDPSCAKEANAQIAIHAKYYPLKSDAFFRGLKNGDSYTISCLGVTTTVRTK